MSRFHKNYLKIFGIFFKILNKVFTLRAGEAVIYLDNGIGDFGGGDDGEGVHDSVGVLLADLRDEQGAHAGAGAAAE